MPNLVPEGWTAATLAGGWSTYSTQTVQFLKDQLGWTCIEGVAVGPAAPSTIFTLPRGYRPPAKVSRTVKADGAAATLDVNTDGTVVLSTGSATTYVILGGVRFRTF